MADSYALSMGRRVAGRAAGGLVSVQNGFCWVSGLRHVFCALSWKVPVREAASSGSAAAVLYNIFRGLASAGKCLPVDLTGLCAYKPTLAEVCGCKAGESHLALLRTATLQCGSVVIGKRTQELHFYSHI